MLFLVFLMMFLGLFALLLGGGLVAQGYLYEQPAERLPLRAVGAAVLVGGFVTLWVWIDRRAPEKYDALFFRGETKAEFNEFEAVRWAAVAGKLKLDANGNPSETTVAFKRPAGATEAPFLEGGTGAPFELRGTKNGGQYMTGAIRVKGPDDAEPVRYNAKLNDDKTYPDPRDVQFQEVKGSRYVRERELGALYVPSTLTLLGALFLNFMMVVVWVVALWPIMRFPVGHSLLVGGALAVIMMVALMPVLFKQNRVPKAPVAPRGAATVVVRFGPEIHTS